VLKRHVALVVASGGVIAFCVGLVLLVVAAGASPVGVTLAGSGRMVLAAGLIATVGGTASLARVTSRRG
jgi:hypothetical protein